jgi:hypothetical protein
MRRPDFSKWLVHLTRERITGDAFLEDPNAVQQVEAFDVLEEILSDMVIRGGFGMVKGNRRVVCLSEIPLASLNHFASTPQEPKTRYRRYGVIVSKDAVFAQGGRPVIYLPDNESEWLPVEQRWRLVRFEPPYIDHTEEREWRVPDQLDLQAVGTMYLVTSTTQEVNALWNHWSPLMEQVGGIFPFQHLEELV